MKKFAGLDWRILLLGVALLVSSLAGAVWVDHFDDRRVGYFLLFQSAPYVVAAWLILREGEPAAGRRGLFTILLLGMAMRLVLLPGWPVSTDLYRYIWDGRVQGAGINPYLYVPADAALVGLRDSVYSYINRADYAPTIYPPTAQLIFYLVTRVSEAPLAMKAGMLGFEGVVVWSILNLLFTRNLPRSRILLYAWHPLPLWEFARSGHLDVIAIAFLLLALVAVDRRLPSLAGMLLGAAALVKFFPAIVTPAIYKRWDWKLPLAFLATILILYLPYVSAGPKVLGFLGGYFGEEGFQGGSGFFLWRVLQCLPALNETSVVFYLAGCAIALSALGFAIMHHQSPGADITGAMLLSVAFTLLASPHYSWYFAWLIPYLCFCPSIAVLYLTCAAGALYFAHWPPTVAQGALLYGPFALLACCDVGLRYRSKMEKRDAVIA